MKRTTKQSSYLCIPSMLVHRLLARSSFNYPFSKNDEGPLPGPCSVSVTQTVGQDRSYEILIQAKFLDFLAVQQAQKSIDPASCIRRRTSAFMSSSLVTIGPR
uniref:Uncharacterized protein n=1 Tax=Lygus hesperus TaxID=30085 RepID=A0A146LQ51_LYGHE